MHNINLEIYKNYSNDIAVLLEHFTKSTERTLEVMQNLELFIENGTAIVGGHIIDNKLVSFIWCYERKFGGTKRLHISYFIVNEGYRGQGLSKELLNFAVKKAEESGVKSIDLNIEPDNEKALKVYEKSGFNIEKLQLVMEVNKDDNNV